MIKLLCKVKIAYLTVANKVPIWPQQVKVYNRTLSCFVFKISLAIDLTQRFTRDMFHCRHVVICV